MLQNIRDNSSGIVAKTIVGLIAITFVITGVNFFNSSEEDVVIAIVGGVDITQSRYASKLEQERRQLLDILGDQTAVNEDLLRQSVLNALIQEASATYYAEQLAFGVSDQLIDQVIVEIPQFQIGGRFDVIAFDRAIAPMGMTRLSFREELRRNLTEYQVKSSVESSVLVTPSEMKLLSALQNQTRSGLVSVIDSANFAKDILVSDDAIKSFYEANQSSFYSKESVALDYVVLSSEDFKDQVKINDRDLLEAYDAEIKSASQDLERRARHILIADGEGAFEKATDLKLQLDKGQKFADLAEEYSDDIASKSIGGDLGFAPKGTFAPAFENVLDEAKLNSISDPIKTRFGYHLIELLETREREMESFDVSAPRLRAELIDRYATRKLSDSLEEFSNIAFSGTLEELIQMYDLKIQETEIFNQQTAQGLFKSESVIKRAFDASLIKGDLNADVFEVEPGIWITFRVREHSPQTLKPLAEVRMNIIASIKSVEAFDRARKIAEKIQDHWKGGLDGLPDSSEIVEVVRFDSIDRDSSENIPQGALRAIFSAPAPSESKSSTFVSPVNATQVAVTRVDEMVLGAAETRQVDNLVDALYQMRAKQEGSEFWNIVTSRVEVVKP